MRTHAAHHRINPGRLATDGSSAGEQLAAEIGTLDGPPEVRIQAVVAASPPTYLTLFPSGEILPRYLGAAFTENPGLNRAASPAAHVSADEPPVFLYHGTADTTVSPEDSNDFNAVRVRAGVRNELHLIAGRGHATTLLPCGATEEAALVFLDAVPR